MKIYITSDTHLGHKRIVDMADRPSDYRERILADCRRTLAPGHVFIHLGDVSVGDDDAQNRAMTAAASAAHRRILVRGNHDGRSLTWYLARGWDWVCDSMTLDVFGARVLLTHEPAARTTDADLNIHGHLHAGEHHGSALADGWHVLVSLERDGYDLFDLQRIVQRHTAGGVATLGGLAEVGR